MDQAAQPKIFEDFATLVMVRDQYFSHQQSSDQSLHDTYHSLAHDYFNKWGKERKE